MNNYFFYLSYKQKSNFLYCLIYIGNLNITRSFTEKLIQNKIINVNGKPFLHIAAQSGKSNIVQYLVEEKRADVNTSTNSRSTLLHLAAQNGHFETVK